MEGATTRSRAWAEQQTRQNCQCPIRHGAAPPQPGERRFTAASPSGHSPPRTAPAPAGGIFPRGLAGAPILLRAAATVQQSIPVGITRPGGGRSSVPPPPPLQPPHQAVGTRQLTTWRARLTTWRARRSARQSLSTLLSPEGSTSAPWGIWLWLASPRWLKPKPCGESWQGFSNSTSSLWRTPLWWRGTNRVVSTCAKP